ncbi:MAG: CPBP family intramembrane glutamic endopeptidase [Bdellovibrio sp.]
MSKWLNVGNDKTSTLVSYPRLAFFFIIKKHGGNYMLDRSSLPEVFDNQKGRLLFWSLLAAVYLIIRFAFTQQLDSLSPYTFYGIEVAVVSLVIFLEGHLFLNYFRLTRQVLYGTISSLLAGFAIFRLAGYTNIQVPFDLRGTETLLFLLLIAPIVEELIFRFFLWQPIEKLTKKPLIAWIITSIIFSYSHLHAIWFVPKEIHSFIIYQMAYTLFLGFACGFFVLKNKSIVGAIAIHFGFNLGFYLGFLA